jgi:hypothetical protein
MMNRFSCDINIAKKRHDIAKERLGIAKERLGIAKERHDIAKERLGIAKKRHVKGSLGFPKEPMSKVFF